MLQFFFLVYLRTFSRNASKSFSGNFAKKNRNSITDSFENSSWYFLSESSYGIPTDNPLDFQNFPNTFFWIILLWSLDVFFLKYRKFFGGFLGNSSKGPPFILPRISLQISPRIPEICPRIIHWLFQKLPGIHSESFYRDCFGFFPGFFFRNFTGNSSHFTSIFSGCLAVIASEVLPRFF